MSPRKILTLEEAKKYNGFDTTRLVRLTSYGGAVRYYTEPYYYSSKCKDLVVEIPFEFYKELGEPETIITKDILAFEKEHQGSN